MLIESFLQYIRNEKNYSSHTVVSYQNDLIQFEEFTISKMGVFDPQLIDASFIRQWIVYLMGEGYSPLSVNRKLSSLKSFFKYLYKMGSIETQPFKKISGPKSNKMLPNFVKLKPALITCPICVRPNCCCRTGRCSWKMRFARLCR